MGTTRHCRLTAAAAALLIGVTLTACGGNAAEQPAQAETAAAGADAVGEAPDGAGSAGSADIGDLSDAAAAAEGIIQGAIAATAEGAGARVVIDNQEYDFRVVDADTGTLAYSYCTALVGTLQGMMQLFDEQGQPVEGSELEFFLFEPGSVAEQDGDLPEIYITLPDDGTRPAGMSFRATEVDAPAQGSTVSGGTFTATNHLGTETLMGSIDITC